jgi:uncharacterized protein YegL
MPYEKVNGNESRESNEFAVAMVLDKSGSMGVLRDAVIEGFNDYLAELRTEPAETSFSLTLFDTRFNKMWVGEPLDRVPPLDTFSYRPDGMTALYDAIAHTVIDTDRRLAGEGKEHVKTLVVVMTDGLENSSTEYDAARLARLVRSYEERPNWTFVYLGAAHDTLEDARLEAARMGWKRENAMRWQADPASAKASMEALAHATKVRRASRRLKSDAFFAEAHQLEDDYLGPADAKPRPAKIVRSSLTDALFRGTRRR